MVSVRNLVLVVVVGLAALLCLGSIEAGTTHTTSPCAVCRLFRTENVFLGVRRQADTESECSTWYRENVESDHAHVWQLSSCTDLLSSKDGLSFLAWKEERKRDTLANAPLQTQAAAGQVKTLEVVVLSTMLADRAGVGEWGFSALVETSGHRILFDTGARPETVLQNARELKIDLSGVTEVILSHHHGDHVGGLLTLRRELAKQNPGALKKAFVGAGIFLSARDQRVKKPTRLSCSRSNTRNSAARSS